jgi:hypothetical protein
MAAVQKLLAKMGADKSGRSSDKTFHGVVCSFGDAQASSRARRASSAASLSALAAETS